MRSVVIGKEKTKQAERIHVRPTGLGIQIVGWHRMEPTLLIDGRVGIFQHLLIIYWSPAIFRTKLATSSTGAPVHTKSAYIVFLEINFGVKEKHYHSYYRRSYSQAFRIFLDTC